MILFTIARHRFVRLSRTHGLAAVLTCAVTFGSVAQDSELVEAIKWYTGVGGRVDNDSARVLLLAAAADKDPLSLMWIARCHSRGRMGFAEDPARARAIAVTVIAQVRQLAADGIAEAIFLMGTAYDEGLGVESDPTHAIEWFRQAGERNHVLAQHNLGNAYFEGRGVVQNDSLAVRWWRGAADQGDAIPQLRLGMMYEEGRGVTRDLSVAKLWYERSARRGNTDAREALERLEHRSNRPDGY